MGKKWAFYHADMKVIVVHFRSPAKVHLLTAWREKKTWFSTKKYAFFLRGHGALVVDIVEQGDSKIRVNAWSTTLERRWLFVLFVHEKATSFTRKKSKGCQMKKRHGSPRERFKITRFNRWKKETGFHMKKKTGFFRWKEDENFHGKKIGTVCVSDGKKSIKKTQHFQSEGKQGVNTRLHY